MALGIDDAMARSTGGPVTVRLSGALQQALRGRPDTLLLLVRAAPGQALPLARAVHAGLADFGSESAVFLTEPAPVPLAGSSSGAATGAVFTADLVRLGDRQVEALPGRFLQWAAAEEGAAGPAGEPAELDLAPGIAEQYLTVFGLGPAARATLRMPPILGPFDPRNVPQLPAGPDRSAQALAGAAADWVSPPGSALVAATGPGEQLLLVVGGAEFPLGTDLAVTALKDVVGTGNPAVVLRSDFATYVRAAALSDGPRNLAPEATLTWAASPAGVGGQHPGHLVAVMREQRDLLREHSRRMAWGQVAIAPDAQKLLGSSWDERSAPEHQEHAPLPGLLADISIPAPAWYQVLTSGHVDRLGGVPPGAVEVGAGRYELTVGEPEQWLPGHPDGANVRSEAARLLAGTLLGPEQAMEEFSAVVRRLRGEQGRI